MTALNALLSALARAAGGHGTEARFPWADVVLIAWRADPQRYGLRGFEHQYPDTKRIDVEIMLAIRDRNNRLRPAFLERVAKSLYQLTPEGLERGLSVWNPCKMCHNTGIIVVNGEWDSECECLKDKAKGAA